jgi:hypothetical protein
VPAELKFTCVFLLKFVAEFGVGNKKIDAIETEIRASNKSYRKETTRIQNHRKRRIDNTKLYIDMLLLTSSREPMEKGFFDPLVFRLLDETNR